MGDTAGKAMPAPRNQAPAASQYCDVTLFSTAASLESSMRTSIIVSALLSFGLLGVAAGFLASRFTEDARATSGTVTASDLARVEERLAALERGLEAIGSLKDEVEALKSKGQEAPRPGPAEPQAPEAPLETIAAALPSGSEGEPSKLEAWLEGQGMRAEFEDLVSRVYHQARTARMAREREEAEERAREMEALSQGPYGKFNYRVNSLSKKLGLDARQEQYLYNLLLKYDERRSQELSQLPKLEGEDLTPDRFKEHAQQTLRIHQELNREFEADLLAGLDPKQKEAYQDLPEHERATGGDALKVYAFEGGAGVAGKAAVRFTLPVAVEKPLPPPTAPPPERK
jgi:hypothetical protein